MSAILLEGGIVHYEVIGRGRPVIFLHGWLGSWRYWIPALQTASTGFRAYAVDLWGFGDTGRETNRYSLQQQLILLERFLNEMGIGRVALVGHGLGAVVAMLHTQKSPETVDRVMAIGCPVDITAVNARLRTASLPELVDWLLDRNPAAEPARVDAVKADPKAVSTSFADMTLYNVAIHFERVTTPCLLVHGQNDPAVANPNIDLGAARDSFHQITLEESGHFPMLEDTLAFNRLLIDWLALESGESPRDLQLKEEWKRRVR